MYLTRLVLENVRAFENLELSFASAGQPRMTNVVIGRNGTGKSTLLRCVVLGLAGQAQANCTTSGGSCEVPRRAKRRVGKDHGRAC